MSQKAITDALAEKANSADVATKAYVDTAIAATSGAGSGTSNLGPDNAGSLVVVGDDGTIGASDLTESAIIEALIRSGTYDISDAVGIEIDYANKFFERK